jgi:predicted ester cyclase
MLRTAFPDLEQTIDDIVATDDKVAFRATLRGTHLGALRTIAATGKRIEMPYHVFAEVVDGKLSRAWVVLDKFDYLQQLGVLPADG